MPIQKKSIFFFKFTPTLASKTSNEANESQKHSANIFESIQYMFSYKFFQKSITHGEGPLCRMPLFRTLLCQKTLCRIDVLSNSRFVESPFYRIAILSNRRFIESPLCRIAVLQTRHFAESTFYRIAVLSNHQKNI